MTRPTMLSHSKKLFLSLTLGVLLGACLAQPNDNVQPVARFMVNGQEARSGQKVLNVPPTGGMITLDGMPSVDPDGSIKEFQWWNTGTTQEKRFPEAAMLDKGKELFDPDLGKTASISVAATEGAVYSLYVIDNDDEVSAPATVRFVTPPPAK